jgi:hypothetical protein
MSSSSACPETLSSLEEDLKKYKGELETCDAVMSEAKKILLEIQAKVLKDFQSPDVDYTSIQLENQRQSEYTNTLMRTASQRESINENITCVLNEIAQEKERLEKERLEKERLEKEAQAHEACDNDASGDSDEETNGGSSGDESIEDVYSNAGTDTPRRPFGGKTMALTPANLNSLYVTSFLENYYKSKTVQMPDGTIVKEKPKILMLMTYLGIPGILHFNEAFRQVCKAAGITRLKQAYPGFALVDSEVKKALLAQDVAYGGDVETFTRMMGSIFCGENDEIFRLVFENKKEFKAKMDKKEEKRITENSKKRKARALGRLQPR